MVRKSRGGVYQRDGRPGWWASVTTNCGQRAVLNMGRTKTDALRRHGQLLDLKAQGKLTPDRLDMYRRNRRYKAAVSDAPTLGWAWEDFVLAKSKKKSFDDDRERWAILTRHLPENTRLRDLTMRRVDQAMADVQRDRGISQATLNRYRALLRSVLMLQRKRTELGIDPSDIRTTREAPRDRVLSREELDGLLGHLDARLGETSHPRRRLWLQELAFGVRLALFTAARAGELGALCWRDVDFRRGSVHFGETKAGGSRDVPLPRAAVELLRGWWEARGEPGRAERVFVSQSVDLGRRFSREAEAAGLPDARFHDLRRTAASRMLEGGMDARVVASITGHRDLGTLLRVYHRASDARRRQAVELLGEGLGRAM